MLTPWGEKLDKDNILQEYPRPQMRRDSYINLNGVWRYAITDTPERPRAFDGEILVPFSPESELSGACRSLNKGQYLWYFLRTELPPDFNRGRVLLHFGAVDQVATVFVNGLEMKTHVGGFTPFAVDITRALTDEVLMILVRVEDATDKSHHSRGKQKSRPGGIWYTPQSGIWQTVWLESVPEKYIRAMRITPHFDDETVEIAVLGEGECKAVINGVEHVFDASENARLPVGEMHPWTPETPYLYDLSISLGEDRVESYFAMRKFSVDYDEDGVRRLMLNNRPYFHNGLLDQGYWSDGLLTPPSDEALIFDIQTAKDMGFNTLRKHIKMESMRYYYHCDRIGMLVWQDMPNGGGRYNPLVVSAPLVTGVHIRDSHYGLFARRSEEGRKQYIRELREMVSALYNCPCIAMWVPFNEGWGQFDAENACREIWKIDQTRTVDHASGWHDQKIGEVKSVHSYFKKLNLRADKLGRAVLLSEFGGYNYRVENHSLSAKDFGYRRFGSANSLKFALFELYRDEILPARDEGLAAAIYTQLSDVEDELNGLITFDRKVVKVAPVTMRSILAKLNK